LTNNPRVDYYEQSSDEIWEKLCLASKATLAKLDQVTPDKIKGIGFDATCSLVVLDKKVRILFPDFQIWGLRWEKFQDRPLSVSMGEDDNWNIIMWRDHRAYKETDKINATNHDVLKYVGGRVSIEMEVTRVYKHTMNIRKSILYSADPEADVVEKQERENMEKYAEVTKSEILL